MGGKSRKSGGVSKKLIERIKKGVYSQSKAPINSIAKRKGFELFKDTGKEGD